MTAANIVGGRLLLPDRCVEGDIQIKDGKIAEVIESTGRDGARDDFSARGCYVAPGFIDIHTQGCMGIDLGRATVDDVRRMARAMPAFGTTAYLATLGYKRGRLADLLPSVNADTGGAKMLGFYLEGPFINPGRLGAMRPEYCLPPDPATLDLILDEAQGNLKLMTVAPELDGALKLIETLDKARVAPAIGHTLATYDEAMRGIEAGQRHATHLFNAMTGLEHRQPGTVGAVLSAEHVTAELICDAIHIHPAVFRLVTQVKGPAHTVLVTDSTCAAGLPPDQSSSLFGSGARIIDGAPRLPDGTIAGSVLTPIKAVENLVRLAGVPVHEAARMLTLTPATIIGASGCKGSLEKGKDADIVLFNDDFEVQATFLSGELAWQR